MSDEKVLRVSQAAFDKAKAFCADHEGMRLTEAATILITRGHAVEQGAASTGPSMADYEAMRAECDRLRSECGEAIEARRAAEMRADDQSEKVPTVEIAPRVPGVAAYATSRGITYEDAHSKLLDLGIRRQAALDTAAQKAKVS